MRKVMFGLGVAALAVAGGASAQVCTGMPASHATLAGTMSFPTDAKEYGVTGALSPVPGLFLSAGYERLQPNESGAQGANGFVGGISMNMLPASLGSSIGLSVCPTAEFGYMSAAGVKLYEVPLGVGFGATLSPPASPISIHPYVVPEILLGKVTIDAGTAGSISSDWSSDFGMRGGVMIGLQRFYFGPELTKVFVDGSDAVFGVRVGVRM